LSEWTQREFGVAFGAPAVARQMTVSDIPKELAEVIQAIEEGTSFLSFEERQKSFGLCALQTGTEHDKETPTSVAKKRPTD
jgi:hypothetical protein